MLPQAIYTQIAPFLRFVDPLPNQLYAVGGRNQQQGPLNTVEMFDSWHGVEAKYQPNRTTSNFDFLSAQNVFTTCA
eukprot:2559157-Amphidinium_carterae.1